MDKSQRICRECWEPYTIGGRHVCKPKAAVMAAPATATTAPVSDVSHTVSNVSHQAMPNATDRYLKRLETDRKRTARWRAKNEDRHRLEHAAYMRKWRRERAAEAAKPV